MTKEVKRFVKKYNLTREKLSYAYLKDIFVSLGYDIIFFKRINNPNDVKILISTYGLQNCISSYQSFIFVDYDVKLLFLQEHMAEDELIHYMLHELGHIWLKHNPNTYDSAYQERTADEFAVKVKILLNQQKRIIKVLVVCSICFWILCVYVSVKSPNPIINLSSNTTQQPISVSSYAAEYSENVYVTKSGEKYHLPNCQHVRYKTNTIEISKEEAVKLGYEPCKVCNP